MKIVSVTRSHLAISLVTGVMLLTPIAGQAESYQDYNSRLSRLEQMMKNREDLEILQQLSDYQEQMQNLQGQIEVLQKELEDLSATQLQMYRDIDYRLLNKDGSENILDEEYTEKQKKTEPEIAKPQQHKAPTEGEQTTYRKAYDLLVSKKYAESSKAFEHYIADYPQGSFVANAYYWLGEIYLIERKAPQAEQAFKKVIEGYPVHQKAADAMLKLGYVYLQSGDVKKARSTFKEVTDRYQGSVVSNLAHAKLLEISDS